MTIRGIFFDAAGVLYRRAESTNTLVSRLLAEHGVPGEFTVAGTPEQQALRDRAQRGQISPDAYWDRRLELHGVDDPELRHELVAQIDDHADHVQPIPGGPELLARLRQRGFILGVVTDTIHPIERKQRWLDAVGVGEFVDVLACSTALGLHKPDPAIYLHALQQAGLAPSESAFVGHAADELDGARRAGLATVAVHYDPHARADYTAVSLLDLLNVPIFRQTDVTRPET